MFDRLMLYQNNTVNLETFGDPSDSLFIKSIFKIAFKLDFRGRITKKGHATLNPFHD